MCPTHLWRLDLDLMHFTRPNVVVADLTSECLELPVMWDNIPALSLDAVEQFLCPLIQIPVLIPICEDGAHCGLIVAVLASRSESLLPIYCTACRP